MTDTRRPPACHYDRDLHTRVTRGHRDDCPNPATHPGCTPCTAPHCVVCSREHLDNDHPLTCPKCISAVRTDLDDIRWLCRNLRTQATRGGRDGRLVAAAPIPGGDAMVMLARAGADLDDLTWHPTLDDDHQPDDPVPPLLPLAGWAHQWRRHQGLTAPLTPTVTAVITYLGAHLTAMAQAVDGPDWVAFTTDMGALRRQLERVLHDEQEPEQGVSCFECGRTLVRKFTRPRPCHHRTPAKAHLDAEERRAADGQAVLDAIGSYPELRGPEYPSGWSHREVAAARPPTSATRSAARVPCEHCTHQGGILDPSVGQSWECSGCRKAYTPGEYANAVRSDLLTSGPNGDGWTHIAMAAEAATTMTGLLIPAATVRKWMDRGRVSGVCRWTAGVKWGQRLVFWADVADAAAGAVVRAHEAEVARRRRVHEAGQLMAAVAAGEKVLAAAKRLGIHPARAAAIADAWVDEPAVTA